MLVSTHKQRLKTIFIPTLKANISSTQRKVENSPKSKVGSETTPTLNVLNIRQAIGVAKYIARKTHSGNSSAFKT